MRAVQYKNAGKMLMAGLFVLSACIPVVRSFDE